MNENIKGKAQKDNSRKKKKQGQTLISQNQSN
jgi:hypothetical protein